MKNTSKLVSFNSPTFLAYVLIAPAVIYLLCIVGWPYLKHLGYHLLMLVLLEKNMLVLKISTNASTIYF